MTPDPAALAVIHKASFAFPRPWTAAELAALLDDPRCFVAAAPEGFALGRAVAGEAELLTIAVWPGARGAGLGGALLSDLLAEAALRGAGRMFLEVAATNLAAIRLYQRAGFVHVATRRGYFSDGPDRIDALVMARDLAAPGG